MLGTRCLVTAKGSTPGHIFTIKRGEITLKYLCINIENIYSFLRHFSPPFRP